MEQVAGGLLPYVIAFIATEWDWQPWMTEPPTIKPGANEPQVLPPGYVSNSAWSIAFEGAYPWAIEFTSAAAENGSAKEYLDQHGVWVECETGYAISLHRWPRP